MKTIFSLFILMLIVEQFCFAMTTNSSDTVMIVKKECKASVVDGNNSSTFSLTYFELDSLPIPLRDSVKLIFEKCIKQDLSSEDTAFDVRKIAADFISPLPKAIIDGNDDHNYNGKFTITGETKHTISIEYSFSTEGSSQWFGPHGGQHGNELFWLDKSTGKTVTLYDVIDVKKKKEFERIDLKHFINKMDSSDIEKQFLEKTFVTNLHSSLYSTYYFNNEGLIRFFQGWDNGSFYSIQYLIPMKELKPLLRKDFEW